MLTAGSYPLESQLNISRDVILEAEVHGSVVLHGQGLVRVFSIIGCVVELAGLNVTGGHADEGGGFRISGATVTVSHSNIFNNSADPRLWTRLDYFDYFGGGGGFHIIDGTVTIANSNIFNNSVHICESYDGWWCLGEGGGVAVSGGFSDVIIKGSSISGNSALLGAGIAVTNGGRLTIINSNVFSEQPSN